MSFGLTDAGFIAKSLEVVKEEVEEDWHEQFGDSEDVDPQVPDGQIIAILTSLCAALWDLLQALNAAFDPDQATGPSLVALCALTGTTPLEPLPSTATATLTGTAGTVVAAGKTISVAGTGARFDTDAAATITAVSARATGTGYLEGDRVKNSSSPVRIYQALNDGTSGGGGGPTTTDADITDGSVHWRYLGDGTGAVDVAVTCEVTGPTVAASGTLTVIETPVSGWTSAINVLDADLGRNAETNSALRLRRELELRSTGNAALDAIRGRVLNVAGVTSCSVFENTTDATDVNGLPPHSIEVLVLGGTDAAVAAAIWASKAGGIATYGSTTVSVADAAGGLHDVKFSRPTTKNIYVVMTLSVDGSAGSPWPSDGEDQVKAAVVAFGDTFTIGRDVTASGLGAQAFKVAGVLDANPVYIGTAPAPGASTTITNSLRELALFDTSRVSVTANPVTP